MALLTFTVDRCVACRAAFDVHLLGVRSGLGPPTAKCLRCGALTATGRAEWPALGARGRLRLGLVTAVYAALVACVGANDLFGVHLMRQGKYPENDPLRFDDPLFIRLAIACGLATVALQGLRVALSVRRARAAAPEPPLASVFAPDLNFGVQLKVLGALCLIYFGARALWR